MTQSSFRAARLAAGLFFAAAISLALPAQAAPTAQHGIQIAQSAPTEAENPAIEPNLPSGLLFQTEEEGVFLQASTLASQVEIDVNGVVARTTIRQLFKNPTDRWLEGIYVFPMPEDAAVDAMTMIIGDRRITGVIKEAKEAEQIYEEAADAGQQASLVSSQRPNIFTTSVANIGPGQTIAIEIQYQGAVKHEAPLDGPGLYSLRLPLVVAPRYIPGDPLASSGGAGWSPDTDEVPDASEITPPVIHPALGKINPVAITVNLDAGFAIDAVSSPQHAIAVQSEGERKATVKLAQVTTPADRDFVLEWTARPSTAPQAAVYGEEVDGAAHLLVMLTPPTEPAAEGDRTPRDVVYVIDTSGSMFGESIVQAKAALTLALERLRPEDRFNVVRFSDTMSTLFPRTREATPEAVQRGIGYVAALEADGGTEMLPALTFALARQPEEGRLRQVVFLTDGAVGNERELFQEIAAQLGENRVFTIGIGSAPNGYFMRKAAEVGRGTFTYISDTREVEARMSVMLAKLESPSLVDLKATFPGLTGKPAEMYPARLPDLYTGEPIVFSARLDGHPLDSLAGDVTIEGTGTTGPWSQALPLDQAVPAPGVAAIWARAKLTEIEDRIYEENATWEQVRARALDVALQYDLVTQYTSMVAVDETVVRPSEEELASQQIATNLPAGWDFESVFGVPGTTQVDAPEAVPDDVKLQEVRLNAQQYYALTGRGLDFPVGATPAEIKILAGLILVSLGLVLVVVVRRRAG